MSLTDEVAAEFAKVRGVLHTIVDNLVLKAESVEAEIRGAIDNIANPAQETATGSDIPTDGETGGNAPEPVSSDAPTVQSDDPLSVFTVAELQAEIDKQKAAAQAPTTGDVTTPGAGAPPSEQGAT